MSTPLIDQPYPVSESSGYFVAILSGPWATTQTAVVNYTKVGKLACLYFPNTMSTANSTTAVVVSGIPSFLMPASFSPSGTQVLVEDNTATTTGKIFLSGGGVTFSISTLPGQIWTGSGTTGNFPFYYTYITSS